MRILQRLAFFIAALAALGPWHSASAAERTARLTIEVQVTGEEVWRGNGSAQAKVKFSQHLVMTTLVRTDDQLTDFNPKDPSDGQQQMQKAASASPAVPGKILPPVKTQDEMQAYVEAQARACNGDTKCLMKLSDEAAQWGAQINGETSTEPDEDEENQEPVARYLQYFGFSKCGATMKVQVDDTTDGSYADVNGPVPFHVKSHADYTGTNEIRELLCTETNVVLDVQKRTLFTDGLLVFDVKGEVTRTERGKTQTIKDDIPLKTEAFNWVSSQLREAPVSGKRQATLTLRKPNGSNVPFAANAQGTAKVELTWHFEDL
jgi:hypothetical protein